MNRFVRFSGAATSCCRHSSANSAETRHSRETRHFHAGSATCSAIAARYSPTIRRVASSQSGIAARHAGCVKINQSPLRSSNGSTSRSQIKWR